MYFRKLSFFVLVLVKLVLAQQAELRRSVVASGGNVMESQNYRIGSTVGQSIIGELGDTGTQVSTGFWYSDIDITTYVEHDLPAIPARFWLNQNYPNPFNPATTISFSIAKSAEVNLSLFDLLGRKVLTLRNEKMQPGEYKFRFEATDLSTGVYFIRLIATDGDRKNHVFIRKMTLIK